MGYRTNGGRLGHVMTGFTPLKDTNIVSPDIGHLSGVGAPGAVVTQAAIDDLAKRTAGGYYVPQAAAATIPRWVWIGGAVLVAWWLWR